MDYLINLAEYECCSCGLPLTKETTVTNVGGDSYMCASCAEYYQPTDTVTYVNLGTDLAVPVLDPNSLKTIKKQVEEKGCETIKEIDSPLDCVSIENDAIVVIELPDKDKRPSPQQRLIDEDDELYRNAKLVLNSNVQVMPRNSRRTHRIYIFFKTDSPAQTHRNLSLVAKKLREVNPGGQRRVYMQSCSTDVNGLARMILSQTGFQCVYCLGGKENDKPSGDRLFSIGFSFEELYDYLRGRIVGQDRELRKAAFLVYDYVDKVSRGLGTPALNWLLTAPSGMGKTELFRAVKDFFKEKSVPIPVVRVDMSTITETGFKGKNADTILKRISDATPGGCKKLPSGTAICFLDEADKKIKPSYDSKEVNINGAVQEAFLTIIEGSECDVSDSDATMDTSNTMFVFMGSFQEVRDAKQKESKGLNEVYMLPSDTDTPEESFYADLSIEDMIRYGMLEELAGRLTMVINFHKLSQEDMRSIISKKAAMIGTERGIKLELTERAEDELMDIAYTNLGVRTPMNVITSLVFEALADRGSSFDADREVIVIDGVERVSIKAREKYTVPEAV